MKPIDLIRLSFANLWGNKLRTILTVLGVSIGIGAIVFLYSLGTGLQQVTIERIAQSKALSTLDITVGSSAILPLDRTVIDTFKALPGVEQVNPVIAAAGQATLKDTGTDMAISGVEPGYDELQGLKVSQGTFLPAVKTDKVPVVVSTSLLALLGDGKDAAVGHALSLSVFIPQGGGGIDSLKKQSLDAVIVGVVDDQTQAIAYIPVDTMTGLGISQFSLVKVKVKTLDEIPKVKDSLTQMGYAVSSISDLIGQVQKTFTIVQYVLAGFGVIALSVASIGMFNTMTIALLERTRDIGIMRALGARSKDIHRVFITESTVIGTLGGVIGIGLAYLLSKLINIIFDILAKQAGAQSVDLFVFPLHFLGLVILFSVLVGFITGVYPALRAARLNPLLALRYE